MKNFYQSHLRIYVIIIILATIGIWSGLNMSVSLFPNSAKPIVRMYIGYGGMSAGNFIKNYGEEFESQLQKISRSGDEVIKVKGEYRKTSVFYTIYFEWGVDHDSARNQVEMVANAFKSRLPKESADNMDIWQWNSNTGFYALSFYSPDKTTNEMYELLEPRLRPKLIKIKDADNPNIWNPNRMDVKIVLDPHKLAKLNIYPRHIINSILNSHRSYTGGVVKEGKSNLSIQINSKDDEFKELGQTLININSRSVYLSQIAKIEYSASKNRSTLFKTNGSPSLILFSKPKGDGNVKNMSEEINKAVESVIKNTKGISYKVLVDPASFISNAVQNVFHEVIIAAVLAVLVLFLFIGNLKNVITIGLEIPLSIIVSFIFMKAFGVNLNLISLGGLALAAGMNVDASIVVLENIFRHLKLEQNKADYHNEKIDKLAVIVKAVKEVAAPIFVSMITTLVVFVPIAFTSELTNAILGDLAKAVIFSHCFSAFVAVFMVPSVRYQIIKNKSEFNFNSPISSILEKIESFYVNSLQVFLSSKKKKISLLLAVTVFFISLTLLVFPRLPKEMIGKPSSDWVELSVKLHTAQHISQMEEKALEVENQILTNYKDKILYTFVQIHNKNSAALMFRLKDKSDSDWILKKFEDDYKNTPELFFMADQWNPASVPIPNPKDLEIVVKGETQKEMLNIAEKIIFLSKENKKYDRIWSNPSTDRQDNIKITPYQEIWNEMNASGVNMSLADLISMTQVAQGSKKITEINVKGKKKNVFLTYGDKYANSIQELKAFPVNVAGNVVGLSALANVDRVESKKRIYREDGSPLLIIEARKDRNSDLDTVHKNKELRSIIESSKILSEKEKSIIEFVDSKKELNDSLMQLVYALGISLVLVFIILLMQFQNLLSPLIIMMAIPLGFIGVTISLYVFNSYISLNSALGIILLNGIAVNNSILLIDFSNKLYSKGLDAYNAVIDASRKRLRPILITSLTTILGMTPIAFGFGEGGKILQPLGVAVSGGLWVSTFLTLIIIPILQYSYLKRQQPVVSKAEDMIDSAKIKRVNPALSDEELSEKTLQ